MADPHPCSRSPGPPGRRAEPAAQPHHDGAHLRDLLLRADPADAAASSGSSRSWSRTLKSGDRVVLSSGIFGTIVGVEDDAFPVRIDDKTRIKVLKSAVAGPPGPRTEKTEKSSMPPALENPLVLWLLLLGGPRRASPTRSCARSCARGPSSTARSSSPAASPLWPPYEREGKPGKIKLGLDLRGGHPPRAAGGGGRRAQRRRSTTRSRPRATRRRARASDRGAQRVRPTSFSVEGVEPARVKDMRDLLQGLLPHRLGGAGARRGQVPGAR